MLTAQNEGAVFSTKQQQSYRMTPEEQLLSLSTPSLESSIEPEEYIVGPGDILAVNIWGDINTGGFNLKVTPEGKLLIPTVACIDLNEMTLAEAKKEIAEQVRRKYIQSDVTVTLIGLRHFKVVVSGQVTMPGVVNVTAAQRVSDAVVLANPVIEEEENSHTEIQTYSGRTVAQPVAVQKVPSKRHIMLRRKSGDEVQVDLHAFERYGNKDRNPYLLEGDVIYVPLFTKNLPIIGVYGAVHEPDKYEYIEGDRLLDLVHLAHGFTYNADSTNIEIARFNPNNRTTYTFKVDLTKRDPESGELLENIPLQVDDRAFVRYHPEYRIRRQVQIKGEIVYPGYYKIELNKTKLSDIVRQAGGFTAYASLKEAFVIRKAYEKEVDLEYERLLEMSVEEMTELEREYFKIKSRERKGLVAVDFVKLFMQGDSSQDVILHDEDYIEIPQVDAVVTVNGQVKRPGVMMYQAGKDLRYYIEKAGGYGWNAHKRKVRIIRGETGEWLKPKSDTIVYVGDTILVPEKPERDNWAIFKDVLSVTVQVATVLLIINNTTSN
ncbi:MAG: SLBB domain-containing protein [candidate division KSB1 bacterium]|jgi:protein involved in polysaccharide export with SLBB domain|nr:SLBB domain-containing protein [candidate division KSB1 bacterium]